MNGTFIHTKWKEEGQKNKILPLYTKNALAERWGVNRQIVHNWSQRHDDFCKPMEGVVIADLSYYPLHEVERYEKGRGLKLNGI